MTDICDHRDCKGKKKCQIYKKQLSVYKSLKSFSSSIINEDLYYLEPIFNEDGIMRDPTPECQFKSCKGKPYMAYNETLKLFSVSAWCPSHVRKCLHLICRERGPVESFNFECPKHKCHYGKCTKATSIYYYCYEHKCCIDGCNDLKYNESRYCVQHCCTMRHCIYKQVDGQSICPHHTCGYCNAPFETARDHPFCNNHCWCIENLNPVSNDHSRRISKKTNCRIDLWEKVERHCRFNDRCYRKVIFATLIAINRSFPKGSVLNSRDTRNIIISEIVKLAKEQPERFKPKMEKSSQNFFPRK